MATEEFVLLAVSLIGLGAGAFGVYDAFHDIKALKLKNGRLLLARANMRAQSIRVLKLALFAVVAVIALANDGPLTDTARTIMVIVLIVIALFASLDAIMDRLSRRKILRHYRLSSSTSSTEIPQHPK